jgi:hypothetical protein
MSIIRNFISPNLLTKERCRVTSHSDLVINTDLDIGNTVNGVVLSLEDRVFLHAQTSGVENGVYEVTSSGPIRAYDYDVGELVHSTIIWEQEEDTGWVCTNNSGSDIVNTDSLIFSQFGGPGVNGNISATGTDNIIPKFGTNNTLLDSNLEASLSGLVFKNNNKVELFPLSQTSDSTINIPDINGTDTLTFNSLSQILINKTFDANDNTLTNAAAYKLKTLSGELDITSTSPTNGNFLVYNGTLTWENGLTAKGQLLTHNGTGQLTLTTGINGQVLSADSVESTGLKWIDAGTGDVVGPISVTDSNIALFDGTTGKLLKEQTTQELNSRYDTTSITTTPYSVLDTDWILLVNTSSAKTINLPSAIQKRKLKIIDITGMGGTNNITLLCDGSDTIFGEPSLIIDCDWASCYLYSDGTKWFI